MVHSLIRIGLYYSAGCPSINVVRPVDLDLSNHLVSAKVSQCQKCPVSLDTRRISSAGSCYVFDCHRRNK